MRVSGSNVVFAAKVLSLIMLTVFAVILGPFTLWVDSAGKDSRPDLLLPLLVSIGVVALGIRKTTPRVLTVSALAVCVAALAPTPLLFDAVVTPGNWIVFFAVPWWLALFLATGAAVLSRKEPQSAGLPLPPDR